MIGKVKQMQAHGGKKRKKLRRVERGKELTCSFSSEKRICPSMKKERRERKRKDDELKTKR